MKQAIRFAGFLFALCSSVRAADRPAEFAALVSDYQAEAKKQLDLPRLENPTLADKIQRLESWPERRYVPRALELAKAQPDDETAFQCCMWIADRGGFWLKPLFDADEQAWQILAQYHTGRAELPMMCLKSVMHDLPAREQFLRALVARKDLSRENLGFATAALAEKLAQKYEACQQRERQGPVKPRDEFVAYVLRQQPPQLEADITAANAPKFKAESVQLFKEVLSKCADVPVTISAPYFRDLHTLGEKAEKSLHGLEHLDYGCEAPRIVGKDLQDRPLDLRDYRGKVVVISFWFTGCGPCMELVPQEQKLAETYKDRPFALIGVCSDEKLDMAQATATDRKMSWPSYFDGGNGPINHNYNVLHWPTIYVLDKKGSIAAKDLLGEELDAKIAELMDEKPAKK